MTPEQAKAAQIFLSRADLKGMEVPAFHEVMSALEAIANPAPAPVERNPVPVTTEDAG